MSSPNAVTASGGGVHPDTRLTVVRGGADQGEGDAGRELDPVTTLEVLPETVLIPPTAAALDALLENTEMDQDELVNWCIQLGDIVAAQIAAGGTVKLIDPDGTEMPLTMPTV